MTSFLRRHSLGFVAVLLIAASFQLMNLSLNNKSLASSGARALDYLFQPVSKTFLEVQQSVKYFWSHYVWLQGIETERNELLARLEDLEATNNALLEQKRENERLRALLEYQDKSGTRGQIARIIGRDPSNWVHTLTLDRGSEQGIAAGQAVMKGQAVVGQVIATTAGTARVLLLTDNSSAIDALAQSNRAAGTVEGGFGRNSLHFRYVLNLKEYNIQEGERIVASGLDGVFPKGALIGVVNKVSLSGDGLFQDVYLEPAVDVLRLEEVLVIK